MKKTYSTPAVNIVKLDPQQMLAGSIQIVNDAAEMDAAKAYSERKSWSSDIWTTDEE